MIKMCLLFLSGLNFRNFLVSCVADESQEEKREVYRCVEVTVSTLFVHSCATAMFFWWLLRYIIWFPSQNVWLCQTLWALGVHFCSYVHYIGKRP